MKTNSPSCIKRGDEHICPACQSQSVVRNGKSKSGKQRYICKDCGRRFVGIYTYNAYQQNISQEIITFTKEGLGIRSTARVLKISTTTLLKRIITIAKGIKQPPIIMGKHYEVDEMRTLGLRISGIVVFIMPLKVECWIYC